MRESQPHSPLKACPLEVPQREGQMLVVFSFQQLQIPLLCYDWLRLLLTASRANGTSRAVFGVRRDGKPAWDESLGREPGPRAWAEVQAVGWSRWLSGRGGLFPFCLGEPLGMAEGRVAGKA